MKNHYNFKDRLVLLFIVLLTFIVWHKVLYQGFLGEGYTFFVNTNLGVSLKWISGAPLSILLGIFSRMDIFARLFFRVGAWLFGDSISVYMYSMLLIMILLNLFFYWLVKILTGKRPIALMAAIFFLANYATSYEIYGIGFYQIFIGRIPNFIPAFLSFILFIKFLKGKGKRGVYFAPVILFFTSTVMSHYSLFFLPIYPFYALVFMTKKKKSIDFRPFFLSLPFFLVSLPLVMLEKYFDPETLMNGKLEIDHIFKNFGYLETVVYQLIVISLPRKVMLLFAEPQKRLEVLNLYLPVVFAYPAALVYIYRKDKKLGKIAFSSLLFTLGVLFLNCFMREEEVHTVGATSRYFFVPFIGVAIFGAILLHQLFYRQSLAGRVLFIAIVCWWVVDNTQIIWHKMNQTQKYHHGVKISLRYLKENVKQFPQDAFLVIPHELGYFGAGFCNRFYGNEKMTITPIFASWEKAENLDLEKLIVLDYDYEKKEVVDKTEEFKELFVRRKKTGEEMFAQAIRKKKVIEMEKGNLID